jgi:hypothetical protein
MRISITRFACAGALVLASLSASASYAQRPPQRYQPSRPTVSPYLNLFRNNSGPLPNYYSLVRPQLYQQSYNEQQQYQQTQQAAALNALQTQVQQQQAPVTQTGKASGYMMFRRQTFMSSSGTP